MFHALSIKPAARTLGGLLFVLCLGSVSHLEGQVLYGSLVGNVTDDTGGALPGASHPQHAPVQQPGQQRVETFSDADGSIRSLNGFAEITRTAAGSKRQVRLGVRLGF